MTDPLLPADVPAWSLDRLLPLSRKLLRRIQWRQTIIATIRGPRPGVAPTALSREQFDRLCRLRSGRARLLNQLRRVHELIEAVSCEEPFTPSPTPSST